MTSPVGRTLIEPRGYAAVSFVSTAMIVGGIGLAWTGLLLAAAGFVLSYIEFKELRRLNPWIMEGEDWPILAKQPQRVSQASFAVVVIAAAAALAAVQITGNELLAIPPALVAGASMLAFNVQMRRALERMDDAPTPPAE